MFFVSFFSCVFQDFNFVNKKASCTELTVTIFGISAPKYNFEMTLQILMI